MGSEIGMFVSTNTCQAEILNPTPSSARAPAPLRNTDEYETMSPPHNNGIIPPIVEPMRIPIQIDPRIENAPSKK
jgi:hypothetical protein